jgi:Domain of unknown function (DUF929)
MSKRRRPNSSTRPGATSKRPRVNRAPWWAQPWTLAGATTLVIGVVIGFLVWSTLQPTPPPQPLPSTVQSRVIEEVTHIPAGVYDAVSPSSLGIKGANPATTLDEADGKPELLYVGGVFCPYCAAERWSLIAALSRFGAFKHLSLTTSSEAPDLPTFTFHGATYQSPNLDFHAVEVLDRNHQPLDKTTAQENQLEQTYDPAQTIPFILIGGRYVELTSGYSPQTLDNQSWQQIADGLSNPNSNTTRAIVGEADELTAAICQITNQPGVCQSQAVTRAKSNLGGR